MNPLWLLLIIPVSASAGFMCAAVLAAGKE
nr:MAG TPA: hypothetical protein [Caudoviricetes sp.]DAQ96312.1 MAG TPA: hypothetical protein [Caudoviricetes sp.]